MTNPRDIEEAADAGGSNEPVLPAPWLDVLAYYREDADIAEWLDSKVLDHLISIGAETLAEWKSIIEFQGFNARELLKTLRRNYDLYTAEVSPQEITITFDYNGRERSIKFSNKQDMMTDMAFLINVFSVRGNVWEKIMRKSTDNLKTILEWMRAKYNIDVNRRESNTALGTNVVTIPRMAACFPMKICMNYSAGIGKLLCGNYDIGIPVSAVIDPSIYCSFFPAMIPLDVTLANKGVHVLFGLIAVINDNVLHKKDKKFTDMDQILSYYQACHNSAVMPQRSRQNFMRARGLLQLGSYNLIQELKDAINTATDRIMALRGQDPSTNRVIEALEDMA